MSCKTSSNKRFLHYGNIFKYVLLAVHNLIEVEGKTPEFDDIHRYIRSNYRVEGDLYSQILNALDRGVSYGFLHKRKNKYFLVCPAATISCKNKPRMLEMERIRSIFHSEDFAKYPCKRSHPEDESQHRKKKVKVHSCGDIAEKRVCASMSNREEDKATSQEEGGHRAKINEESRSKSIYEFYT